MLFEIFRLIADSAAGLLVFALLLRALMQWVRLHPRNPLAPFVFGITDWLVRPLRRWLPGFSGVDWASLLGAFLVAVILNVVLLLMRYANLQNVGLQINLAHMVIAFGVTAALLWLLKSAVYLLMGIVLLHVILSWVSPFSPITALLQILSRPFLQPLQRVLPNIGNIDLSPMVLFLVLQILIIVVERLAMMVMFY